MVFVSGGYVHYGPHADGHWIGLNEGFFAVAVVLDAVGNQAGTPNPSNHDHEGSVAASACQANTPESRNVNRLILSV